MVYELLTFISSLVVNAISNFGYPAVFLLMSLESALIPIPSEIIMPFSGFLVFEGRFSFWEAVMWGTFGNLFGSILAYLIGFYGGRPLVEKYGKYVLITRHDLDLADKWFAKYGSISIFFSRVLPVVRTFISLPAGIAKMNFWKFSLYTFLGSLIWSIFLTYAGVLTGEKWKELDVYFKKFDWLIGIAIVLGVGFWAYKKFKSPALKSINS